LSPETQATALGPGPKHEAAARIGADTNSDPFDWVPQFERKQVRFERELLAQTEGGRLPLALSWLDDWTATSIAVDRPEVLWRASGLNRPGLVAQLTAPRLGTRIAVGIELPLAHAVVDRLLGFDRSLGESRLQLTPVEWGIWTFLILRLLETLQANEAPDRSKPEIVSGALGASDLTLDRVGPDSFDPGGLGAIVTVRWPVRVGNVAGAVRLWVTESVVQSWTASAARVRPHWRATSRTLEEIASPAETVGRVRQGELGSLWRAEAGCLPLPQGLRRLRVGGVLPFSGEALSGSPASLSGPVGLILDLTGQAARFRIPAHPIAESGARLLRVDDRPIFEPHPRDTTSATLEASAYMTQSNPSQDRPAPPPTAPLDVPVTLTVELGRVNLTLAQLADLKPGDVVELSRHSRAPVDLTSGGRLVARGELIKIDTELGVRLMSVFL
jgi:type III secretion system YscQ/HrcQ family protein